MRRKLLKEVQCMCVIYIYMRERDEEEVVFTNTTCKWTVYLSLKLLCLAL